MIHRPSPSPSTFSQLCLSAAFTLVELLTVIAIIGILAGILIPVVGRVRESANSARCLANLRQLATAGIAYGNENNGFFPGYHWDQPGETYQYGKRGGMADQLGLTRATGRISTVMTCPTAQRNQPVDFKDYAFNRTYAINGWARSYGSDEVTLYGVPVRFSQVDNPSRMMFFVDSPNRYEVTGKGWFYDHCVPTQKWDSAQATAVALLQGDPAYIHSGKINISFADGHVESVTKTKLIPLLSEDRFWKGSS
ncbi:prepilin-type N-terminal cleavage/methylation domain-containing protein [Opitutaceae bacterium TAV1]|nr:prepilin-type N-terminal cleavage/methylation domain-containing protein [Opitutaceae bacterium TAV1]